MKVSDEEKSIWRFNFGLFAVAVVWLVLSYCVIGHDKETRVQRYESIKSGYDDYKDKMKYIVSSNYVLLEVKESETFTVSGGKKYIKLTLVTKDEPGYSTLPDETFTRVYPYDYYTENIAKSDKQVDYIPTMVERCFLVSGIRNSWGDFTGGVVTSFQSMDKALNMGDIDALVDTLYSYDCNSMGTTDESLDDLLGTENTQNVPTFNESYYRLVVPYAEDLPNVTLYDDDIRQLTSLSKLTQSKFRQEMNAEIEKADKYFTGGVAVRSYTDYSGEYEVYKESQRREAMSELMYK